MPIQKEKEMKEDEAFVGKKNESKSKDKRIVETEVSYTLETSPFLRLPIPMATLNRARNRDSDDQKDAPWFPMLLDRESLCWDSRQWWPLCPRSV